MISIRQMTENDDEAVCRISAACYRFGAKVHDFTEQQVNLGLLEHCTRQHVSSLRSTGNALVAELDGQLVGVIITSDNIIQALFVDPTIHRKGIGRALFQHAEKHGDRDVHEDMLLVTIRLNSHFFGQTEILPQKRSSYTLKRMKNGQKTPKNGGLEAIFLFFGLENGVLSAQNVKKWV